MGKKIVFLCVFVCVVCVITPRSITSKMQVYTLVLFLLLTPEPGASGLHHTRCARVLPQTCPPDLVIEHQTPPTVTELFPSDRIGLRRAGSSSPPFEETL